MAAKPSGVGEERAGDDCPCAVLLGADGEVEILEALNFPVSAKLFKEVPLDKNPLIAVG